MRRITRIGSCQPRCGLRTDQSRSVGCVTKQVITVVDVQLELWTPQVVVLHSSVQKKFVDPSVRSSKRPQVQSTTGDVPDEDMHGDPTVDVGQDGDDEVGVDTAATMLTGPPPPSLRAMMETFMMTQAAHG
nr:hypothetical protein CFP56_14621 [Quercus suber]